MANFQFWIGIVHFFEAACIARKITLMAASPLGKSLRDLSLSSAREEYRDIGMPKLFCRVGSKFKSFGVITKVDDRMVRVTLGRFPEMNLMANKSEVIYSL
jgi:hypothetical protein